MSETTTKGRFGWVMYDWAAQPFFTVIVTFIFGPYFVNVVTGDPLRGQVLWADTQAYAGIALALTAPFLGAFADAGGRRKPWVTGCSLVTIVACSALWFATPEADDTRLFFIVSLVVIGIIGAESAIVFNNAMLPDLVSEKGLGKLSGQGWAMGYAGALLALPIMLWVTGQLPGVPGPQWDASLRIGERLTGPFVAIWFAVFMIPFLAFTPEHPARAAPTPKVLDTVRGTWATIKNLPKRPNVLRYLIARMAYYDGLNAVFAFGSIYAAARLDWSTTELGLFGIIILLFGAPGCLLGGWVDGIIGPKRSLYFSVGGLFFTTLAILSVGDGHVLFVVPVGFPTPDDGLFASHAEHFMVAMAVLLGVFAGPSQAASRTLLARIAPRAEMGKYFGLFALSGKATSFLAPLAIGFAIAPLGDRLAYGVILVFLGVGLALLAGVREEREPD